MGKVHLESTGGPYDSGKICIIEMYNTSRNENHQPPRGGVLINDENYWPVKLKHRSSGHIKWANLHSDESTVQSIIKETVENTKEPYL